MPEAAAPTSTPVPLISGITDLIGGAVGDATSSVVNSFSKFLWDAGLQLLQGVTGLADHVGTVNLDIASGPLAAVWPVTLGIGLPLAGILFYVQLVTVSARGGRGLLRALQGCAQFGVALAASAGVFTLLLLVADSLTEFILHQGLDSANFTAAFAKTGFSDTTANAVKGPALGLLSVFGVIPIALGFAFENVMRAATIYLLVAVIPVTAAGLLSGSTRSWFWKTANWAMAAIAVKPVMALALWIGVAIAGTGAGLAQLITGLAVMFVSLVAPLALFKLFAFSSTAATDAFKSGWSQAGGSDYSQGNSSGSQGGSSSSGSQGSSSSSSADSSSAKASTTMESNNEARYSTISDDTASDTNNPSGGGGGADTGDGGGGASGGPKLTKDDVGQAANSVGGDAGNGTPATSWPTDNPDTWYPTDGGSTPGGDGGAGSAPTPAAGGARPPQGPRGGGGGGGGAGAAGGAGAGEAAAVVV